MEKRIIKFRGKSVESGEWVYGSLLDSRSVVDTKTCEIVRFGGAVPVEIIKVFANSVHQYTNIKDSSGNEIYEGDIVRQEGYWANKHRYSCCGTVGDELIVRFDSERCGWYPFACGDGCGCCETETYLPGNMVVVGNIYDKYGADCEGLIEEKRMLLRQEE